MIICWCDTKKKNGNTVSLLSLLYFDSSLSLSKLLSHVQLCDPMDCSPTGSSVHKNFPGKNTGVGSHSLLQGIFPAQESNQCLPNCRQILYHLSHHRSPFWFLNTCIYLYILLIIFPFVIRPSRLFAIFILNCLYLSHKFVRALLVKIKSVFCLAFIL